MEKKLIARGCPPDVAAKLAAKLGTKKAMAINWQQLLADLEAAAPQIATLISELIADLNS
jgi:hypothetical protein